MSLPKLFATLLWLLISLPPLLAQHLPGLSTSNYAGTFGAIHNPSYVADTRHGFAFNLGTVHSSINRDYFRHFPSEGLIYPLLTPYRQNLYATSLQNGSAFPAICTTMWGGCLMRGRTRPGIFPKNFFAPGG